MGRLISTYFWKTGHLEQFLSEISLFVIFKKTPIRPGAHRKPQHSNLKEFLINQKKNLEEIEFKEEKKLKCFWGLREVKH